MSKVCERAALTESGCLKMTNGNTTPESYMRKYRKEIDNATHFSIKALREETGIYSASLCLGCRDIEKPMISGQIDEMQEYFMAKGIYYDFLRYDIDLSSENQFFALLAYAHLARRTEGFIRIQSFQNRNSF